MPLIRIEDGSGLVAALTVLQRQTIVPYPTAAARAAQWPNPPVGALTFRVDGAVFEWFNGTTWAPLP